LDEAGREVAGLAMLSPIGVRGLCLDTDDGHESLCISLIKNHPQISLAEGDNDRIALGVHDGVAQVVLSGADGKARLRLEVDKEGRAHVEGLNRSTASQ